MDSTENKIVITSDVHNITLVENLIDDLFHNNVFQEDLYGKILLAVTEGVNNAIVHGNNLDVSKSVEIIYNFDSTSLEFFIKDEGIGFDYTLIPDPTLAENIEKSHGRGIFLMYHLADTIEFLSNGSVVKMTFNL